MRTDFVYGQLVHNWDEQPPRIIYYGLVDDLAECKTTCYADNECFAATRFDLSGLQAENSDWPMRCWGVSIADVTFTSTTDADSAMCLETRTTSESQLSTSSLTFN